MHRIDTSGNVANRFSEGNPQAGQLATRLSAAWFNDVQENLIAVLTAAGIAPVKGNEGQLLAAIVALIAGAGGGGEEETDVPITRQVLAAGLATGGGPLASDVTITVSKATAAEITAGVTDDKAVTPLGLKTAFASVFSSSGYAKLPGGLIVQWGTGVATANSTTNFTLPLTFPNANLWSGVEGGRLDTSAEDNNPFVSGRGTSTISVFCTQDVNIPINFIAIGY